MKKIPRKFLWKFNFYFIIVIIIFIILLVLVMAAWFLWGGGYFKEIQPREEIRSRIFNRDVPGYVRENVNAGEENIAASYKPSAEAGDNTKRVVDNVAVRVIDYATSQEAQKPIEEASLVYIWEWRKEKIAGREVNSGFLRNKEQTRYEAAYLAWTEGNTYFELIARADDIRDFSDKEFLWQSAKEVAESILGGVY